jgi:hypothetical protein
LKIGSQTKKRIFSPSRSSNYVLASNLVGRIYFFNRNLICLFRRLFSLLPTSYKIVLCCARESEARFYGDGSQRME